MEGRLATDADVIERANRELFCEIARRTPGGRVVEQDGLLMTVGRHPSPVIVNTGFRLRPELPCDEVLDRMVGFYSQIGHGFGLMVGERDADLERAALAMGWRAVIEIPSMVIDRPSPVINLDEAASLRRADPKVDLAAFRSVLRAGFADDADEADMVSSVFAEPVSIAGDNVRAGIVSVDAADVSAGLVMVLHGLGVVAWIATVPEYRRRGLGAAVTAWLTMAGFELGATRCTLQASPMGFPIYQRLGYQPVARYRVLFPPELAH